jgi:hypothetical protein
MTAPEFVLWGYKPSMCPLGLPIKITGGTVRYCRTAQRSRKAEGWLFGIYPKGAEPAGLRDQIAETSP